MCVGMFMAILDIQVVASSLPAMAEALDIAEDKLSWIQTSYLIAEIIAIPLTGFLTRAVSVRWLFAVSTAAFTLASIGCAMSDNFAELIALRTIQGFCGGALIPTVFTTIFVLFEGKREALATTIAGSFAMIAPTLGPAFGGWLTESYSWHAIFLINVITGDRRHRHCRCHGSGGRTELEAAEAYRLHHSDTCRDLPCKPRARAEGRPQAALERRICLCIAGDLRVSCAVTIQQCLARKEPFVNLRRFRDRSFTVGCILSFVLGFGLFSATYMTPVFLGFVRGHTALDIGKIMIVAGAAQLLAAPFAAYLETRHRRAQARLRGICGVRGRPHSQRFPDTPMGFRRILLAAGFEGRGDHVLSSALHAACARRLAQGPAFGCERAVQPDAQSGRRHRDRAGRYRCRAAHPRSCRKHLSPIFRREAARRRNSSASRCNISMKRRLGRWMRSPNPLSNHWYEKQASPFRSTRRG